MSLGKGEDRAGGRTRGKSRALTAPAVSLLLVSLFVALLATRAVPLGIPGQWVWPHRPGALSGFSALLAVVPALGVALFLAAFASRPPKRKLLLLLWAFGATFALRAAMFHAEPLPALKQVWTAASPVSNTYFSEALKVGSVGRFVRNYVKLLPKLTEHARTHPPGPVVYYRLFLGLCRAFGPAVGAADWWASATTGLSLSELAAIVGGRTGLPLDEPSVAAAFWAQVGLCALSALLASICSLLSLSLGLEARVALLAASLFALSPSANLFSITVDTLVALLCASALLAVSSRDSNWRAALAGALLYLAAFTSLSALAMGALLVAFLLLRGREGRSEGLRSVGWLALGFLLTYALFRLALGFDLLSVAAYGLKAHKEVTAAFERSYLGWLLLNPLDFAALGGLPIVVLAPFAWKRGGKARPLLASLLLTLALLDVSGLVRGEVARIWLFLLPPLCVASAEGLSAERWPSAHLLLLALQTASAKVWLDAVRPF